MSFEGTLAYYHINKESLTKVSDWFQNERHIIAEIIISLNDHVGSPHRYVNVAKRQQMHEIGSVVM